MAKPLCFHCRGRGFHPWSGTKILHAVLGSQEKKNSVFRLCLIPLGAELGEAQNYSQLSTVELEECKNGL